MTETMTPITDAQADALVTFARTINSGREGQAQWNREVKATREMLKLMGVSITKEQAEGLVQKWYG